MENSLELAKAITTPRAAYAAFNRGDFDAALKSLDPQIEWSEPPGVSRRRHLPRTRRRQAPSHTVTRSTG